MYITYTPLHVHSFLSRALNDGSLSQDCGMWRCGAYRQALPPECGGAGLGGGAAQSTLNLLVQLVQLHDQQNHGVQAGALAFLPGALERGSEGGKRDGGSKGERETEGKCEREGESDREKTDSERMSE